MDLCGLLYLLELQFVYCKRRLIISQGPACSVNDNCYYFLLIFTQPGFTVRVLCAKHYVGHWQYRDKYNIMCVLEKTSFLGMTEVSTHMSQVLLSIQAQGELQGRETDRVVGVFCPATSSFLSLKFFLFMYPS